MLSTKKDKLKKLVGQSQRWSIPFKRKGLSTAGASASSVCNSRTRRAVHKGHPLWAGELCPRGGASHGVERLFGCSVVHSPGMRVPGCLAVCPCDKCQGVSPVKAALSKGETSPSPVLNAPAVPSRTSARNYSHETGLPGFMGAISHRPAKRHLWRTAMKQKLLRLAVLALPLLGAQLAHAQAVPPATALEAVESLSTSAAGFGPVMFGLAVVAVGIGIGVKWIKRAKGAA